MASLTAFHASIADVTDEQHQNMAGLVQADDFNAEVVVRFLRDHGIDASADESTGGFRYTAADATNASHVRFACVCLRASISYALEAARSLAAAQTPPACQVMLSLHREGVVPWLFRLMRFCAALAFAACSRFSWRTPIFVPLAFLECLAANLDMPRRTFSFSSCWIAVRMPARSRTLELLRYWRLGLTLPCSVLREGREIFGAASH